MNEWMDGWVNGGEKDQKKIKKIANSIIHHNLKESIHFVKQSVDLGVWFITPLLDRWLITSVGQGLHGNGKYIIHC